ncbi:Phospholipase ABHD3 [Halotydeus destructor]|nr:Phospholipase ABHD3 [Halotydeus destructor]
MTTPNFPTLSISGPFGGLVDILHSGMDSIYSYYANNPRMAVSLIIFFLFLVYYLREVVKPPELFCRDGKFRWFILANLPQLQERYWPTFWCFGTHGQTAIANGVRFFQPDLKYERQFIHLDDGGQVSLDWYADASLAGQDSSTVPVAVFFPGLTGDSQTEYIKSLVPQAQRAGYRCVAFNNRGRGGMKLLTPKMYCAANCSDVAIVMREIKNKYPRARVVATGVSLGGILLSRYLIEMGQAALVDAAVLMSVCWDFVAGSESMEQTGLNMALNQHLAKSLCSIVNSHKDVLEQLGNVDFKFVMESKTLAEFDERFTSKQWGYKSAKDYYHDASNKGKLNRIKVPAICITAADDMFCPLESLPIDEIKESSHVAMIVTQRGGHIGFMDGLLPKLPFYSERLCGQIYESLRRLENIRDLAVE